MALRICKKLAYNESGFINLEMPRECIIPCIMNSCVQRIEIRIHLPHHCCLGSSQNWHCQSYNDLCTGVHPSIVLSTSTLVCRHLLQVAFVLSFSSASCSTIWNLIIEYSTAAFFLHSCSEIKILYTVQASASLTSEANKETATDEK